MKNVRFPVILAVIALASFAGGASAQLGSRYLDVPQGHWAEASIAHVSSRGLMSGPGNRPGYFDPDGPVNRAQLAAVLQRIDQAQTEQLVNIITTVYYRELARDNLPAPDRESLKEMVRTWITTGDADSPSVPEQQLGSIQRNNIRRSDVDAIAAAAIQYAIDNNGVFPPAIPSTYTSICRLAGAPCAQSNRVDLTVLISKYLIQLPVDPLENQLSGGDTGYSIMIDKNGRVYVRANLAEDGVTIEAVR